MDNIKEEFNEYDEPEFTQEEEIKMYGEVPTNISIEAPQYHGVNEAYEIGDIEGEGEENEVSN